MSAAGLPGQVVKRQRIRAQAGSQARESFQSQARPSAQARRHGGAGRSFDAEDAFPGDGDAALAVDAHEAEATPARSSPEGARDPSPAEADAGEVAALGDTVPWVRGLLPRHHRSEAAVTSLAHHLRLLPQLGFDEQLSVSIAYLSGAIGDAALRGTALAHAKGWDTLGDRDALYAAVRWFVGRTCVVRARSVDSPTHAASLPRSRTAARLGFPNPRRGAAAADAAALADASSRTHRRRANARIDALCALVDMLCGRSTPTRPWSASAS